MGPHRPLPPCSPQPPTSDESSSEPSTSPRSHGLEFSSPSHSQPQVQSGRSYQLGRPHTAPLAEEQPGLEVYHPPAPPADAREGRPRVRRPGTAPSFWSKEVADNPSQYTFFRDPSPTPPQYREREEDDEYTGTPLPRKLGRSSMIALETARTIPPPDPKRNAHGQDAICGLGRRMFLIAVAAVVLLVLGIAVGVGVGVGVGKKAIQDSGAAAATSSMPSTTANSTTSTRSGSTPSSSSSTRSSSSSASPIPTAVTDCPYINNTIYQVPGSTKNFLRLCGIDYSGGSEAVELAHKPTFSFEDCIGNCAGTYGCTGCGWGVLSGDEGADHQCWMKSNLTTDHKVASDWCFAILQD